MNEHSEAVETRTRDKYNRTIGDMILPDGTNVNRRKFSCRTVSLTGELTIPYLFRFGISAKNGIDSSTPKRDVCRNLPG